MKKKPQEKHEKAGVPLTNNESRVDIYQELESWIERKQDEYEKKYGPVPHPKKFFWK